MKLLNFNIIKLTIYLIIGIIIGYYIELSLRISLIGFSVIIILFGAIYFIAKRDKFKLLFSFLALLIFISFGILRVQLYDDTSKNLHYMNAEVDFESTHDISFYIYERLKRDNFNQKYFAKIISVNSQKTIGKILLNITKDTLENSLKIGQTLFTNTHLQDISKPKNPFQFNYKSYLKRQNVNHQIYLKPDEFLITNTRVNSFYSYADDFRTKVSKKLKNANFSKESLAMINALLLGQRQYIDSETYNNYADAGVIHILAVSGLHIGIIYLILGILLKPLHRIKHGKFILKPLFILVLLWVFDAITGLSPSVTRATTMFSIVAISGFYRRPTNIYNTLIISAFALLLFKPLYLFDVGFQLSYIAVFAIVSIQPLLYKLYRPPHKLINLFWETFTVTLAAQIGVAPLSLFYFHQFPGLFFLSNLVIIPCLGFILGFGILIITLAYFDSLPYFLAYVFDLLIQTLNSFIAWVAQFEVFLIRDISFNLYLLAGFYVLIISLIYLWKQKSGKAIQITLVSLIILTGLYIFNTFSNNTSELVIFNKNRNTLLALKEGNHLHLFYNNDTLDIDKEKPIKDYKIGRFISNTNKDQLNSVYKIQNSYVLVIDSLGIYEVKRFKPDYVLLTNSPKINLDRLIKAIKPKEIIADASNYKSYISRWKATCKSKKIPFHSTYEKGAYIIK